MPDIATFFQTVKLPVMSEVAHSLIKTLNDEDASSTEVCGIISKDPAITAKILRLANSASFGLPHSVSTLPDAVSLVGMSRIRTLCLAACMGESFPVVPGLDRKEFWRSCMVSAGYAQWISKHLGMDSNQAWLASMMARLGELIIAQAQPASLTEIEKLPHLPGGRWERETQLVGFSEGQITAELARRWKFPKEIVHALDTSTAPLEAHPFDRLGGIAHLSMLLADMPPAGAEMLDDLPQELLAKLLLRSEWLKANFPRPETFYDTGIA